MPIKIGLVGLGHLGKIHLKCLQQIAALELVGIYDIDQSVSKSLGSEHNVQVFDHLDDLIQAVSAIDIVTPTASHFQIAAQSLAAGKHLFIEKPITATPEEAHRLLRLWQGRSEIVQVGHVERFNPAMMAIADIDLNPKFIEVHRLANFNPRGTDVSVVLDLMIHDLDIILSMVPSKIKRISANGVPLVSKTPDIGNARIEWENGCVANVTASRLSLKNMRKMRLFQEDAYIAVDFLEKSAQIIRLGEGETSKDDDLSFQLETDSGTKTIQIEMPEIKPVNAIKMELESFANSIQASQPPQVGIHEATRALELAFEITEAITDNFRQQTS